MTKRALWWYGGIEVKGNASKWLVSGGIARVYSNFSDDTGGVCMWGVVGEGSGEGMGVDS